jgi:hypothetical protein
MNISHGMSNSQRDGLELICFRHYLLQQRTPLEKQPDKGKGP